MTSLEIEILTKLDSSNNNAQNLLMKNHENNLPLFYLLSLSIIIIPLVQHIPFFHHKAKQRMI